jgi:ABC-type phosphate transport system permease subunit
VVMLELVSESKITRKRAQKRRKLVMETINKPTLYAAVIMVAVLAIFLVIANAPERAPKSYKYDVYQKGNVVFTGQLSNPENYKESLQLDPLVFGDTVTSQTVVIISMNP